MKEKTLNERVKDSVRNAVLDSLYEKLQKESKEVMSSLEDDEKYNRLKNALEDYKTEFYSQSSDYQKIQRTCLRIAFHVAAKTVRGVNFPYEYIDNDKVLNVLSTRFVCDTDTRIASLICKINGRFTVKKATITAKNPYTIAEIRKLIELVNLGILDHELVRQQVRDGKRKR